MLDSGIYFNYKSSELEDNSGSSQCILCNNNFLCCPLINWYACIELSDWSIFVPYRDLSFNKDLTGPISPTIGNLKKLTIL